MREDIEASQPPPERGVGPVEVDPAVIEAERLLKHTPLLISAEDLHQQQQQQQQHQQTHLGRGKKWQPEEDEQLSRAWLKVSQENPSANAEQRAQDTFWTRVADEFLRASPASRRPPRSIQQRWAKLHQSISQFGESYEEQEARLGPAATADELMVEALKQYKLRTDHNFAHYSCWAILRHRQEWSDHLARPRMEKDGLMALNDKRLRLIADLLQAITTKNQLLAEFNRLEKETNQIKIMSQFNSSESQLWFKLKQQEILNEFNLNILS
ncbi:hypothetical protein PTTG_28884 [Puccinia triticina 1-1 BBBD Race 1]|uniref:Myb-like domain-containing protein n=2 Tax=Puccinia triticina TaxID=208348 RepID=A0A180G8A0_PUCT1|nr:uncharacterized protein PtA15_15A312 [Puccinia triticina]OAV88891.1 hypothetical protein PTTG_28884 [Puccinia triticina 1-1 BBBD Race 1]WAQ91919.1 hypothetical protein PtA15_15A312 [Puccinia triticina]WAR62723.1 hypothetical protein PtB15_15B310 [Puccinia triticina]